MKKTKFTEAQIVFALRQADTGTIVAEVYRKMGTSEATCLVLNGIGRFSERWSGRREGTRKGFFAFNKPVQFNISRFCPLISFN